MSEIRKFVRKKDRPPTPPYWKEPEAKKLPDHIAGYQILPLPENQGYERVPVIRDGKDTGIARTVPIVAIRWFVLIVRYREAGEPYTERMGNPAGYANPAEAYADLGDVIRETWTGS